MSCDLVLKSIGMNKLDRGRTGFPPTFSYRSIAGYGFFRGLHRRGNDCLAREAQMEEFVHSENLKLYRKMLAETTDEQKRQTLLKLLSDEEAKDAQPSKKGQS
jgi:hypothetical protein